MAGEWQITSKKTYQLVGDISKLIPVLSHTMRFTTEISHVRYTELFIIRLRSVYLVFCPVKVNEGH
jgi:hypothetical protein